MIYLNYRLHPTVPNVPGKPFYLSLCRPTFEMAVHSVYVKLSLWFKFSTLHSLHVFFLFFFSIFFGGFSLGVNKQNS